MRAVTSFPALQPHGLQKLKNCPAQSNHGGYGMRANKIANKLRATEAGQPQAGAGLCTFFAELAAGSPPLRAVKEGLLLRPRYGLARIERGRFRRRRSSESR